ncbi:MAG TPA: DegQ family serine endoprotease [Steroidobacteraceae bacterium]|nr:DegQ family serine endoprotease [Steroidobacteraceae bacterium]
MKLFSQNLAGLTLTALLVSACSQASTTDAPAAKPGNSAPAVAAAAAPGPAVNYSGSLPDFTVLVDRYGSAVVNVSVIEKLQPTVDFGGPNLSPDDPFYDFFKRFRGAPRGQQQPSRGLGSGFIISSDGYILTNAHVVADASEVTVRMNDRRELSATVVGIDRKSDVAVIKVDAKNLPTVTLGDPSKIKPGEWVVAIGSPFGLENSVTAGIVSATSRALPNDNYTPFIQTDVPVNPGNSGGPLFNMRGEVIGINSQIYSQSGGYMGISFAIPIDVAVGVKDQLVKYGKVSRGRIGVTIQDVNQDFAESFGLDRPHGALVSSVEKDGPAAKAGIEPGDVILKVNGTDVDRSTGLPTIVAGLKPGSTANIEVFRKGAKKNFDVKVAELQETPERVAKTSLRQEPNKLGLSVRPLTADEQEQAETEGKLLVEDVSGPAARAGVQPGDIILGVNGSKVSSVADLSAATGKSAKTVALLVQRENGQIYIPVRVEPPKN